MATPVIRIPLISRIADIYCNGTWWERPAMFSPTFLLRQSAMPAGLHSPILANFSFNILEIRLLLEWKWNLACRFGCSCGCGRPA